MKGLFLENKAHNDILHFFSQLGGISWALEPKLLYHGSTEKVYKYFPRIYVLIFKVSTIFKISDTHESDSWKT